MKKSYFLPHDEFVDVCKKGIRTILLVLALLAIFATAANAQTAVNLTTTTGSPTWTVPAGVTQITVEVWGGGGGGGSSTSNNNGGSGGGAGGYAIKYNIDVTPGQVMPYTVGTGGNGGATSATTAPNGNASTILGITANGGTGGGRNRGPIGLGGSATGGDTNITGGNGEMGGNSGGDGGNAPNGGNGGNGATNNNGGAGSIIGGGGGGGEYSLISSRTGGAGARGQIRITYTLPTISSFNPINGCQNPGTAVTINGTNFTDATSVTFNGVEAASFTVVSATQIIAVVPVGATTGKIRVTIPGGFRESSANFTVNPSPSVNPISGSGAICPGETIQLANTTPGGIWTSLTPSVASVNASGLVSGISSGTAIIQYQVTGGNGCATAVTASVDVHALPVLGGPNAVCIGSTMNLTPSTGGTWVSNNPSVASIDNNGLVTGLAAGTVTFTFTDLATGCSATTGTKSVNQLPSVTSDPSPVTACTGSSASFSVTGSGTALTYQWYNGLTPLSNGGNISGANTATLAINPVTLSDQSANYNCVISGFCSPSVTSANAALTVVEGVTITSQPSAQMACEGGTATFEVAATGQGLSYQWYNGGTMLVDGPTISGATTATLQISSLTAADASSNYYVIVDGTLPCGPLASNTAALVINQTPAITANPVATQPICAGSNVSFTVSATGGNLSYQWFNGGSQLSDVGNISGASTPTLTITNATPLDTSADYHVVVSNGCGTDAVSASAALTVNERPEIPNQAVTICSEDTFNGTPLNGFPTPDTIVPAGTTYSWPAPVVTGGLIGASAQSNQTVIGQMLVNPTNTVQTATYTVTPTSGTGGNCDGIPFTVTVTVNPRPFVINSSQTACSGTTFSYAPTNGGGNLIPAGTTYSWGLPVLSGAITGATAGTDEPFISQTLFNTTGAMQTATYTVTANSGNCVGSTFNVVFNVYPTPDVAGAPLTQTVCSGEAISAIALSNPNGVSGTIDYSWTRNNTANVTGLPANGFGSPITGSLVNTTNVPQTVTFWLTATSEFGCASNVPFTVEVIVNPKPTVAATPASQSVCSGSAISAINISNPNNVGGTTYSWTRDNTANLTGIAASGTSASISGTLVNTTSVAQTTTFTIKAVANGCESVVTTVSVTVNPQPIVVATPSVQTACSNSAITSISLTDSNAIPGVTFSWTRNNTASVTGMAASGSGNSIAGMLVNTTTSPVTVTFTITAVSGGCASATTTAQVTVNPSPSLSVNTPTQSRCNNTAITAITFTNTNSLPGTTFSWTRDNTSNITGIPNSGNTNTITGTAVNNTGVNQTTIITMTATAPNGCSTTMTASVTVYPTLTAPVIGNSQTVCVLSTPGILTQITPVSGGSGVYAYQWQISTNGATWNNIGGATAAAYQPPFINLGADNRFYRLVVTNTCGTVTSNSIYIEVVSNVGFTFDVEDGIPGANTICSGASFTPDISSVHFSGSSVRYAWTADSNHISPAVGGPVGTTSGVQLFIFRTSSADIGPLTAVNNTNASVTVPVTVTPSVYNYNGPPQGNGSFICSVTPEVINVTILPRPVATIVSPPNGTTICSATSAAVTVTGNITDANMYYTVTRSTNASVTSSVAFPYTSANFAPGQAFVFPDVLTNTSTGNQNVTYTITPRSASGCIGTPVTITITVARPVTPGAIAGSQTLCSPADPAAFTQTQAASGNNLTYQWYSSTVSATGPWTPIAGATATTYNPPAGLTQTTWYIREVISTINGVTCTAATTTPVLVTINDVTAGTIGNDLAICNGEDPAAFTVITPATGSGALTYSWEYSTVGCSGPWTAIPSSNVAAYNPPVSTETRYYRRTAISTLNGEQCTAISNCVAVIVNTVTGGTVGSDETLCGNNPSAFTQITPATGLGTLTYQWQSNIVGCGSGTWTNIPGATSATYDPPAGLTQTTYYRRVVTSTYNGIQCTAVSNCITVTANSVTAGAIGTNQTVCNGGDPAAFTSVVAATGTGLTYQWQISTVSPAGPWTNISGANSATYDAPGPLTQTTYYQRVATGTVNGVSCDATSNAVTVFVNSVTAPVIAGDQTFCAGENPSAFTVTTPATASGSLSYQWQSSTVGCSGPWTNISGATGATYDPPVLAQTTYYHVVVTSTLNSVNCTATSNCITVESLGKTWNGSAGTNWNNPANWTPNGIPTNLSCVIIPNVPNKPVISGTGYVGYAHNLTVLNGGQLTVASGNTLEVTNFVNVSGTDGLRINDDASLVQIDNVPNVGIAKIQRTTPPVYRYDYTYWNSPVTLGSNYTLGDLSPTTQYDKFYSWNPSVGGGTGNWIQESVATVMNPNRGYIVRAPQTYSMNPADAIPYTATFTGTPNNGTFAVPIIAGSLPASNTNDKLNLIGNPYPSAVDADAFLSHPTNAGLIEGTIYFWTHNTPPSAAFPDPFYGNYNSNYTASDYATYTTGMGGTSTVPSGYGGAAPDGHIATGQSFFVIGLSSGNAVFENNMRVRGNNDVFFRPANPTTAASVNNERHRIWLNLANTQGAFSQILVGYAEGATNAKDRNYDGESFAGSSVSLYSLIEDRWFAIQGRALPFEISDTVPLGYNATLASTFTIGIDRLDGLFENQNVYLEDKLLNVIHDLKSAPYSFASAAGRYNDRFVLRYTDSQLGVGNPNHLSAGAYLHGNKLFARASVEIEQIEVFDISGKKVATYEPEATSFETNFLFSQGVYIAKIKLSDGSLCEVKLAQ